MTTSKNNYAFIDLDTENRSFSKTDKNYKVIQSSNTIPETLLLARENYPDASVFIVDLPANPLVEFQKDNIHLDVICPLLREQLVEPIFIVPLTKEIETRESAYGLVRLVENSASIVGMYNKVQDQDLKKYNADELLHQLFQEKDRIEAAFPDLTSESQAPIIRKLLMDKAEKFMHHLVQATANEVIEANRIPMFITYSTKGGVGKTLIASSLADYLVKHWLNKTTPNNIENYPQFNTLNGRKLDL